MFQAVEACGRGRPLDLQGGIAVGIALVGLLGLVGLLADDGAADLVARLGSTRFAEREAAADSLRKLGPPALPALRKARSSTDPEIKIRASDLVLEIESAILLNPTMVRLDFADRPLGEVIDEFGRRTGLTIDPIADYWKRFEPRNPRAWPDRRITLQSPEPLPFWTAIDRLSEASALRRHYPVEQFAFSDQFQRLVLVPGTATPPKADTGPFRVELIRIRREREVDLAPGRAESSPDGFFHGRTGPEVNELRETRFFAELLVSVEPRLRIIGWPRLEHETATDAQGRSVLYQPSTAEAKSRSEMLRMNPHLDPALHPEFRFVGSGSRSSSSTIPVRIRLAEATPPGRRLAELKGVIAVAVMGRRPGFEPLVVPLASAPGTSVSREGCRLTIHKAEVKPSQFQGDIDLTIESGPPGARFPLRGPGLQPIEIDRPFDLLELELEIVDDQGLAYRWGYSEHAIGGVKERMRLHVNDRVQTNAVDLSKLSIRFWPMAGAVALVPFSFTEIDMP